MKFYKVEKLKDSNIHRVVILSDGKKVDVVSNLQSYDEAVQVVTNLAATGEEYDWSITEIASFESSDKQQAMFEVMSTMKGHDEPKVGSDYMNENTLTNPDDILLDSKLKKN